MIVFTRLFLVLGTVLLFTSCGGGESSSSGGSGVGGTGVTQVRGNVSKVNGQDFVYITPTISPTVVDYMAQWLIPLSFAQSNNSSNLIVSGGGQSSTVNAAGEFILANVSPSSSFVMTFTIDSRQDIPLNIGEVQKGAVVTVSNIAINTNTGNAQPGGIEVVAPDAPADGPNGSAPDESEDDVSESEDDVSESDEDVNENEDGVSNSEDDVSESDDEGSES